MQDDIIGQVGVKYQKISPVVSEKILRDWAAVNVKSLFLGGIPAVSVATEIAISTIRHQFAFRWPPAQAWGRSERSLRDGPRDLCAIGSVGGTGDAWGSGSKANSRRQSWETNRVEFVTRKLLLTVHPGPKLEAGIGVGFSVIPVYNEPHRVSRKVRDIQDFVGGKIME